MQKTVYYSKKYQARQAEGAGATADATAARAVSVRRSNKLGIAMLVVCLAIALGLVLVVPTMVGGATAPAAGKYAGAQVQHVALYATPEEAMQAAGVAVTLPTALPEGYTLEESGVADGKVLQLRYGNGSASITFRAAAGSADLSGADIDGFAYTATETVDGIAREYTGNGAERLAVAVWAYAGQSYSLVASGDMDAAQLKAMAESIF